MMIRLIITLMESCPTQSKARFSYVVEVGFVPEPPQLYGVAALVAGEPHVHWLRCKEISHSVHGNRRQLM